MLQFVTYYIQKGSCTMKKKITLLFFILSLALMLLIACDSEEPPQQPENDTIINQTPQQNPSDNQNAETQPPPPPENEDPKCTNHELDQNFECVFCGVYHNPGVTLLPIEGKDEYMAVGYYDKSVSERIIPAEHKGKPVTQIAEGGFMNLTSLQKITIPDSVHTIGSAAFHSCANLEIVELPKTLSHIGSYAFKDCVKLEFITIPKGVTEIHVGTFRGCTNLICSYLPDTITRVEQDAFADCPNLDMKEYNNAYYIGNTNNPHVVLLKAKHREIASVTVHKDTKVIYGEAFREISTLTDLAFENNCKLVSIERWAFYDCYNLERLSIPYMLEYIGEYAFADCAKMECRLSGRANLKKIDEHAFENCESLYSVMDLDGLTSIGPQAFDGCDFLEAIDLPSTLLEIGEDAFSNTSRNLESINVDSNNPNYKSVGHCLINSQTGELLLGCKNSVIPQDGSITSIGDYAFSGCYELTGVSIPAGTEVIGFGAFYGCSQLKYLYIPASVTKIEEFAFMAGGLEEIVVNKANTVYHSDKNCLIETATKTLILGCKNSSIPSDGSVVIIGNLAFDSCRDLGYVSIPEGITKIGKRAFYSSDITGVNLPKSLVEIDDHAFAYCYDIENTVITIPANVTRIGRIAFWNLGYSYHQRGLTIIFENTEGWKAGDFDISSEDLSDVGTATKYLGDTYDDYEWIRY